MPSQPNRKCSLKVLAVVRLYCVGVWKHEGKSLQGYDEGGVIGGDTRGGECMEFAVDQSEGDEVDKGATAKLIPVGERANGRKLGTATSTIP